MKAIFLVGSAENEQSNPNDDITAVLVPERKEEIEKPPMYKVLILNDDYTPMEFVVAVLQAVFTFSPEKAFDLMLTVHNKGVGVAGVFIHEIAETKANQVLRLAQEHGHPLMCTIEKE
ncbi:MAG: ATP-dependent Clp protease adapter ClpS [Rhodobacteraceae bacterium]|nr:ATP-dependent Clp protease adapter ClpS [Paracoccaceae bacterium]MYF45792.1 ATP-dependent Clp protease adapter ClpS [Paracoccaceae bacterium]MYI90995.1 ATP-dependent Clp protease adapter ClpS [Paracoccaceae bacterium]